MIFRTITMHMKYTFECDIPEISKEVRSLGRVHLAADSAVAGAEVAVHVLQSNGKGHHSVGYELQLLLEEDVLLGELVVEVALPDEADVVRSRSAVWVATLEVVLPEL